MITVDAPHLRIVDDALWTRAHERLNATRAAYKEALKGQKPGRPRAGAAESPYLLTGFLVCRSAGATSRSPVSRPEGARSRTTSAHYVCATHRWRGAARCPEGVRARMEPLEQAILQRIEQAVLSEDIITEAAERAIALYRQARASDSGRRERTARALQEVGREVERYVQAIGKGVDVGEIPEALARAKARREALTAELGALTGPERTPTLDREEVRKSLRQWRGRLRQAPAVARRLLRVLLPEPLVLERVPAGIRFRGQLAIGPLLIGLVPDAGVSALVPPGCHARTSRRDCLPR